MSFDSSGNCCLRVSSAFLSKGIKNKIGKNQLNFSSKTFLQDYDNEDKRGSNYSRTSFSSQETSIARDDIGLGYEKVAKRQSHSVISSKISLMIHNIIVVGMAERKNRETTLVYSSNVEKDVLSTQD